MQTILNKLGGIITRTDIFCAALLWLIILLFFGTITQKDIGLYAAQHLYFSSYIIWIADIIPIPSGMTIMTFIFISLFVKLLTDKWEVKRVGTIIVHLGVLLLLIGGFITALYSYEGNMLIRQGQSSNFISDYNEVELVIFSSDKDNQVAAKFLAKELHKGQILSSPALPFKILVKDFYRNSALVKKQADDSDISKGMLQNFNVINAPVLKEDEANISTVIFSIDNNTDKEYTIIEQIPLEQYINADDKKYLVKLRHARTYLPFSLKLINFEKKVHAATDMAKSYKSEVVLTENNIEWPAIIEMNSPLRYKGYTFYQSAFTQDFFGNTTILAVVNNKGRLFPYISSIIICIGLLIHMIQRIPALSRKHSYIAVLAVILLGSSVNNAYANDNFDYQYISSIPILQDGRVKPLGSFAKNYSLIFNGKHSIENMPPIQWFTELLLNPDLAYKRKAFNIPNPELVQLLKLNKEANHRHTFEEIWPALHNNFDLMEKLSQQDIKSLSITQTQLLQLYQKAQIFLQLSYSLGAVLPAIVTTNETAKALNIKNNGNITYIQLMQKNSDIQEKVEPLLGKSKENITETEKEFLSLAYTLKFIRQRQDNGLFKIIPPQWNNNENSWFSPWESLEAGHSSPASAEYMNIWSDLAVLYNQNNIKQWDITSKQLLEKSYEISESHIDNNILSLETFYNNTKLFQISLALYVLCFLLICLGQIFYKSLLHKISLLCLCSGGILHCAGLIMRMIIMERPPVTTLYESIIFVSLIIVVYAVFHEYKQRDGTGIITGSLLGAILGFISMRYSLQGDTMQILAAVLDTNFWLATHVVTITIGYSCCLVAGTLAHIYLIKHYMNSNSHKLSKLYVNIFSTALVGLFFSLLGTILGGIWADQSWGRFWGWDPKENGALLIVLWLILLLHGKIAGILSKYNFTLGMVFTNIIVIFAWFGVNLLNVGLHSYGFTENIATNTTIFYILEILFIVTIYILNKYKKT